MELADWLSVGLESDFFRAKHGIPDKHFHGGHCDIGLTEAHLDDAIRELCAATPKKGARVSRVTTPMADVTFLCTSIPPLDRLWPIWEGVKQAVKARPAGIPILMLAGHQDGDVLMSLVGIGLNYKTGSGGFGGAGLVKSASSRDDEWVIVPGWHLWRAVSAMTCRDSFEEK